MLRMETRPFQETAKAKRRTGREECEVCGRVHPSRAAADVRQMIDEQDEACTWGSSKMGRDQVVRTRVSFPCFLENTWAQTRRKERLWCRGRADPSGTPGV